MSILLTDQGRKFSSKGFDEWLEGLSIEHQRCIPYHPQTNGQNETLDRTIKMMLNKLTNCNRCSWKDELGPVLAAVWIAMSFLYYARHPRAPLSHLNPDDPINTLEN